MAGMLSDCGFVLGSEWTGSETLIVWIVSFFRLCEKCKCTNRLSSVSCVATSHNSEVIDGIQQLRVH